MMLLNKKQLAALNCFTKEILEMANVADRDDVQTEVSQVGDQLVVQTEIFAYPEESNDACLIYTSKLIIE